MSLQKTREFMLQEKMISLKDKGKIMDLNKEVLGTFAGKIIKIGTQDELKKLLQLELKIDIEIDENKKKLKKN